MKNIFSHWKTTMTGLTMIIGAVVWFVFNLNTDALTEANVMTQIVALLGGIGFIFAPDSSKIESK